MKASAVSVLVCCQRAIVPICLSDLSYDTQEESPGLPPHHPTHMAFKASASAAVLLYPRLHGICLPSEQQRHATLSLSAITCTCLCV